MTWTEALLAVSAAHAGFQLVVSVVVYPALAEVGEQGWATAHAAHSRRISLVVGPLYLALIAVNLGVLIDGVGSLAVGLAVLGNAIAGVTTALVAAPTHGSLGLRGPMPRLIRRLLVADWIRTGGALLACGAALIAVS